MDNIFGVGLPELILILIIAGMVMGPERLVRTARSLGVLVSRMQSISRKFVRQLNSELDHVDDEGQLKKTAVEFERIRRDMAELQREFRTIATGTLSDTTRPFRELKQETENTILPNDLRSLTANLTTLADAGSNNQPAPATPHGTAHSANTTVPASNLPRRLEIPEDPDQ
jgi:Sec-independent protein translocase protein TatA